MYIYIYTHIRKRATERRAGTFMDFDIYIYIYMDTHRDARLSLFSKNTQLCWILALFQTEKSTDHKTVYIERRSANKDDI